MPVVRFIADTLGGGVPLLAATLRPVPMYPSLIPYCLKRQVARPGFRGPKLTFEFWPFANLATLSLQRPFALVGARATGATEAKLRYRPRLFV